MVTNARAAGSSRPLGIASIWLALGVFDATRTVVVMRSEGMHHAWLRLFVVTAVSWLPWAAATPVILRLGRRFPPRRQPDRTWAVHAGMCAGIATVFSAWDALLESNLNPYADMPAHTDFAALWLQTFANGIVSSLVLYGTILTLGSMFESRARLALAQTESARLNERLAKAQLHALRAQIEPHFLFNALNSVAGLIRESRPEAAVGMIAALGDFLRRMLDDSSRQTVSLREELASVRDYLHIAQARFGDRLAVAVHVSDQLYEAEVPNLVLQPLVENALKHGIARRAQGGAITITAERCDERLTLRVGNDGPGLPPDWDHAPAGIGIANVRARLRSLYGDSFALHLSNVGPNRVEACVLLPLRGAPAALA